MESFIRRLAGLSKVRPEVKAKAEAPKLDQQTADVANAAQRVNERTDQVRATLAELLKAADGQRRSVQGLQ